METRLELANEKKEDSPKAYYTEAGSVYLPWKEGMIAIYGGEKPVAVGAYKNIAPKNGAKSIGPIPPGSVLTITF